MSETDYGEIEKQRGLSLWGTAPLFIYRARRRRKGHDNDNH